MCFCNTCVLDVTWTSARSRNRTVWSKQEQRDWERTFAADKLSQKEIDELRERAEARRVCPKRIKAAAEREQFLEDLEGDLVPLPPRSVAAAAWTTREATELGVLPHKTESDCDVLVQKLRGAAPELAARAGARDVTFGAYGHLPSSMSRDTQISPVRYGGANQRCETSCRAGGICRRCRR